MTFVLLMAPKITNLFYFLSNLEPNGENLSLQHFILKQKLYFPLMLIAKKDFFCSAISLNAAIKIIH